MTPSDTLLSRARAYLQNRVGRTALTVAPLATLGLMADSARAIAPVDTVTFDPAATITYPGDSAGHYTYNSGGGMISGAPIAQNANGVNGATFTGLTEYDNFDFEGGNAGVAGSIQAFSIQGNGSGTLTGLSDIAQIHYDFTLSLGSIADIGPVPALNQYGPSIVGGSLDVSVTTGGIGGDTFSQSVPITDVGTYTGDVGFNLTGTTLVSYSAVLTINYSISDSGGGVFSTITATVPTGSIDFDAIPEPSTWLIIATGAAGLGLRMLRVRQRPARRAPVA